MVASTDEIVKQNGTSAAQNVKRLNRNRNLKFTQKDVVGNGEPEIDESLIGLTSDFGWSRRFDGDVCRHFVSLDGVDDDDVGRRLTLAFSAGSKWLI